MFTIPGVRKFHEWTHASLTALLDHLSTIPDSAYTKEVSGFGFPSIRAQVIHIFNCEGFWVHTLQAIPFDDEPTASWPTVSDARRLQSEVSTRTLDYLSRLSEQNLNAPTELHFPDEERGPDARTHPPPRTDSRFPSQRADRRYVPYFGLSRARHRSESV